MAQRLERFSYKQRHEADLAKMLVRRQNVAEIQLLHEAETETGRERPWMVFVLAKELSCLLKAVRIHPLYPAGARCEYRFE